jgi:hypothetical protein
MSLHFISLHLFKSIPTWIPLYEIQVQGNFVQNAWLINAEASRIRGYYNDLKGGKRTRSGSWLKGGISRLLGYDHVMITLWSRSDFTFSKSAACFWVIHVPFSEALECCGYSSCLFCRDVSVLIRFSSSYLAPFQASHPHEISSFPAATMLWRVLAVLTSSSADRPDFCYRI